MLKKLVIVFISVVVSLFFAEGFLRVFNINVKQLDNKNNFTNLDFKRFIQTAYIDIYDPFFKIRNGYFKIQRNNIWRENDLRRVEEFRLEKQKNKKRIFIIGESAAEIFRREFLEQELFKYFDIEIINCGMSSYDSFRIERVTRELRNLNPDWIIFLMGNNAGERNLFSPVMINPLPYKYKIINKIRILSLLSNLLYPDILMGYEKEKKEDFHRYIRKILKNLKDINTIFVDLPNNEKSKYQENDHLLNITRKDEKKPLIKDTMSYKDFLSRIEFLKKITNNKNIFITNLTDVLRDYTNNELGYNIFYDNCHFSTATYKLLSQLITQIIVNKELNRKIDIDIDKNKFYKLLKYDHSFICKTHFNDFGIQNCYNLIYADFIIKYNEFKNFESQDYLPLVLFLNSLYEMKPEKNEEIKIKLKELIKIQPGSYEAPLLLGYIYYSEKKLKKSKEYLDIAKKLAADNINVKYLNEKINETENSCN